MNEVEFKELLQRHVEVFLSNISRELEESHHRWFDDFGFPMFGVTSKEFFEQVYFQSYYESYFRKMINGVLKALIDSESEDEYKWPEFDFHGIYNGYTNSECEKEFGFEFINLDTRKGFRYTTIDYDEIETILQKWSVSSIEIIIWEDKEQGVSIQYGDERIQTTLFWDFFQNLLVDLDQEQVQVLYELFVREITQAAEKAKAMISLVTLPGFTPSFLHKNRNTIIRNLESEIIRLSAFYVSSDQHKETENNSRQLIEEYKLSQLFLENNWSRVFVGKSRFSKSFLTSEYLYLFFNKNPLFDFTPIISGYMKSIEQLLHAICKKYQYLNNIHENMSKYTLEKYTSFFERHEKVFQRDFLSAKSILIDCLNSYRIQSRNPLFHKASVVNWEIVDQIRRNTIFLYVTLLGMTDTSIVSSELLGILDDRYDRLFHAIEERRNLTFSILIDGKKYTDLRLIQRKAPLCFDRYGLIKNSIQFVTYSDGQKATIEINRDRLPTDISLIDARGNICEKLF